MHWFEKMGVLYKYFLDSVQKVLLLMHKLTNLVDIVYQRMVNVCFVCGNELETRGSAIPSFHINAFILKATLKAEWTEKDPLATNTDNNVHKDVHKDVHKEISERQSLIISMIQDNPALGRIEMSTKLGLNEKTIRRDLDDLKEKGIIVRIGGRKEGHWEINKNK